jgi:polyisoprenoid-binding protein YceI
MRRLFILLAILLAGVPVQARTTRFDFRDVGLRNLIHFVSDAPLEKILGISNFVSGWIELDPDHLGDNARGEFQVDVRTFETGIDSRNDQLRDKVFDAAEFPIAVFTVQKILNVSQPRLGAGQPISARIQGLMKIKGVSHPQDILVKLLLLGQTEVTKQRLAGNLLKLSASFDVDTSQYNLTVPDAFRERFSKFVQVEVDAIGTDSLPMVPLARLEGPKPKDRHN